MALTPAEKQELHHLILAFEVNGGRGVEIAERIDELRAKADDPRYHFSVIELTGESWAQGRELYAQTNMDPAETAEQIGATIAANLDDWIAQCDTGPDEAGETYAPALEINITRALEKGGQ